MVLYVLMALCTILSVEHSCDCTFNLALRLAKWILVTLPSALDIISKLISPLGPNFICTAFKSIFNLSSALMTAIMMFSFLSSALLPCFFTLFQMMCSAKGFFTLLLLPLKMLLSKVVLSCKGFVVQRCL